MQLMKPMTPEIPLERTRLIRSITALKKRFFRLLPVYLCCICAVLANTQSTYADEIVIGVLAPAGEAKAIKMWQPTIDYLQQEIPQHSFKVLPATKPQLSEYVARQEIDFFLTNTGHYVELEATYGATRILTLKRIWQGQTYSQWGSTIVVRADNNDIYDIADLKGKRIAAVYKGAFAGFQVAFRELVKAGVLKHKDHDKIIFTGLPHSSPLHAVYDRTVDAGSIPTGVLEEAIASGRYKNDTFRVINRKSYEHFPFQVSTQLYPLWPLAKTRYASEPLAEKIVSALLRIPADHKALKAGRISGWTVPLDYSDIHDLMREIKVGPYKNYGNITLQQFIQHYWQWLLLAVALFCFAILIILYVTKLNTQLQDARDNLELKVDKRTQDLAQVNRQLLKEIQAHEQLQQDLINTRDSLSKAQEISHLGNWRWDIQNQTLSWSDEIYRIFGLPINSIETTYENFLKFVHPDDRNALQQAVQDSINDPDIPYSFEHRIIHNDKTERYVHEQGEVIWSADGQPLEMLGTVQDITQRKMIELQLEQAAEDEELLGLLLQLSLRLMPLSDYLNAILKLLTDNLFWLQTIKKSCIFLTQNKDNQTTLKLAAEINLSKQRKEECATVPLGKCLCGQAAETRTIIFSSEVDEKHEILPTNNDPHGHYCVPIEKEETLLGVLMIQLPDGHRSNTHEFLFLKRIADVLSMGISRHQAEDEIEYYAYHDTLTNLPNRRLLQDRLEQEVNQAERTGDFGAVIYIDLDNFKNLNDSLGHPTGDKLLLQVSERLLEHLRRDDTISRLGGDEFVIVLPSLARTIDSAANAAGDISEKIRLLLREPYLLEGHEYHASASLGITLFPKSQENIDDLLKQADSALYEAKKSGRDTVYFYQRSMQDAATKRLSLERDIRSGIIENEFVLYYQPQMNSAGELTGAEALVRWQHPTRGFISPVEFIPVAEESGLILPLGKQILNLACDFLTDIHKRKIPDSFESLSINISPKQFKQPDFVATIKESIDIYKIDTRQLMLEITEGVLVDNIDDVADKMRALNELSIRFSIDDFGTGYSSMTYLKNLPLGELKIDQSFVRDAPENTSDVAIIEAITSMSKHFGIRVVAEGVETETQLAFLKSTGCQHFQGFYFDKPLSADEFKSKYL